MLSSRREMDDSGGRLTPVPPPFTADDDDDDDDDDDAASGGGGGGGSVGDGGDGGAVPRPLPTKPVYTFAYNKRVYVIISLDKTRTHTHITCPNALSLFCTNKCSVYISFVI